MIKKNNIRSIRFSDELAELIERQQGRNFNEKFENLITRCVWELPQREEQIRRLDKEIAGKRAELQELSHRARTLESGLRGLTDRMNSLANAIDQENQKYMM